MRISLWNAYASNNSGSYTIVGGFSDPETAARAVEALRPVLAAHTAWHEQQGRGDLADSPLARFAVQCGVPIDSVDEEWPEYGGESNCPEVLASGHQILLHHSYTASMPRFFGWWIYAQGGRVATEMNHAHGPVVASFTIWWSWNGPDQKTRADHVAELLPALADPNAGFRTHLAPGIAPVICAEDDQGFLCVTSVFADLVAGCAALRELCAAHDASISIRVHEGEHGEDPLRAMRNVVPPDPPRGT
jgi:hypothetical protein